MNAYELADELDKINDIPIETIINMLRQQADRIAELEKALDWIATVNAMDYEYQDVAKSVLKQTKPAPEGLIDPKSYYIGYEDGKKAPQTKPLSDEKIWSFANMVLENSDVIGFARAIEERHGIK